MSNDESGLDLTPDDATVDDLFAVLSHSHRRVILTSLLDVTSNTSLPIDTETFLDQDVSGDSIRVEQHHVHLPRLDETGFITWNRDDGTVEQGPQFETIQPMLTRLADNQGNLPVNASD